VIHVKIESFKNEQSQEVDHSFVPKTQLVNHRIEKSQAMNALIDENSMYPPDFHISYISIFLSIPKSSEYTSRGCIDSQASGGS